MGVLRKISDMRDRRELCDVVVIVEKERFYVHKLVLAAASEFFHAMFTSGFQEKDKSEIELIGQTAHNFKRFLCYVYSEQVELTEDNIGNVYSMAIYLQAEELIDYCENFMMENINVETCFTYLAVIEQFPNSPVFDKAVEVIAQNFLKLSESRKLSEAKAFIYKKVLQHEKLADVAEEDILETTFGWIETNNADEETTVELFQEIRWALLELDHLKALLQNDQFIQANEACRKMVERAVTYLEDEQMQPILGGQFSTPRGLPILAAIGGDNGEFIHDAVGLGAYDEYFWDKQNIIEPLPQAMHFRECNAYVVISNILFLVGGYQDNDDMYNDEDDVASANVFKYTPLLNQWDMLSPLSNPRCGHAVVSIKYDGVPHIMVIGGCSKVIGDVPTTVVYDIKSDSWSERDGFPHQVLSPAACVYEGIVYVSGGRDDAQCKDFMYRFTPETRQWEKLSSMLYKRSGHSMCVVSDNIYIIGVRPRVEHPSYADSLWAEMYNPKLDQFSKVEWIYPFFAETNIVARKDRIYRIRGECSVLTFDTTDKDVHKNVFFDYKKSQFSYMEDAVEFSTASAALVIMHVPNRVTDTGDDLPDHEDGDPNNDPYSFMLYQNNLGLLDDFIF